MRVAHVSTWDTACGIAHYTRHLRDGLEQVGIASDVVAIDRERTRYYARRELREYFAGLVDQAAGADVIHVQHEFGFFEGAYDYRASVVEFRRFLRATLRLRRPTFVTFHTDPFWFARATSDPVQLVQMHVGKALWRTSVPPLLNRGRGGTALVHSRATRAALIDSGVAPERVTVMRHGVPAAGQPAAQAQVAAARERLGVPPDATVLGVVGFISEYKGHMTALRALALLPEDHHLVFIGGQHPLGHDRTLEHVLAYLDDHPELADRLTITGYRTEEQLREDLAATDMLLAPYGGGTTLSASGALGWALTAGRPVIASRIPSFSELEDASGCLELVTPDAPNELALAIERLNASPARRAQLGRAAAAYAEAHSWERTAAAHARLYAAALGRPAPARALALEAVPEAPAANGSAPAEPVDGGAGGGLPLIVGPGRPARADGARRRGAVLRRMRVDDRLEIALAVDPGLYDDPLARHLVEHGYPHDPPNVLVRRLVPPGGTFVDVGAHLGTFSIPVAAAGARVLAIDASQASARLLRTSIEANDLEDRCRFVHGVAGASTGGTVRFTENGLYGFVNEDADTDGDLPAFEVPTVAVDDLLADLGWEHVDVLKIDVEGFELEALAGMSQLLGRPDAPVVVVECNADMLGVRGATTRDLRAALQDLGYELHLIARTDPERLVPVTADDVQTEAAADLVGWKSVPARLAPWYVSDPFTPDEIALRLRDQATSEAGGYRRYAALAIRAAPPEIRDHPENVETLKRLAWDADPEVRRAAVGVTPPERYGVAVVADEPVVPVER